ncbi:MAG: MFS transporter [Burkholderiales bacterium]|nr:MFS transporter [Burkholderiales bacterium]
MSSQNVKNESWLLFTLAGMFFTHILDFMIMMPLGPQLIRSLHINTQQFGWLLSCYTFSAAISSVLASYYVDRFDRRPLFLLVYFLFMLATLCCGLVQDFYLLMVARVLAGAFGGLIEAMVQTIIADVIPFERRGVAIGKVTSAFSFSIVAGVPIGLFLANFWPALGWHAPFFFLGLVCFGLLLLAWRYLPSLRGHLTHSVRLGAWQNIMSILRIRQLLFALLFVVLLTCGGFMVTPFITLYLTSNVGIAEADIPSIYFCAGVATLFSSRLIGKLADRYGKQKVYRYIALSACVPILLATQMTEIPFFLVLLNCIALFMLVPGRMICAMGFLTQLPAPHQRGTFMSLFSAVQMVAIGFSTFLTSHVLLKDASGHLLHFDWIGLLAIFFGLWTIYLFPSLAPQKP